MKQCPQCHIEYKPSSNHKLCPKCRYENKKDFCECGNQKSFRSKICVECSGKRQSGELNGRWKGGKTINKKGYVLVKNKAHPRSKSNGGYVFEHILVMEEKLGRYLIDGENVHHLNGIKNDNRIENLELWTRPQPSGIRASDAVAWAKQILSLYDT